MSLEEPFYASYLQVVSQVTPNVMAKSLDPLGRLKDARAKENFVLLADGKGVRIDPDTVDTLQRFVYGIQIIVRSYSLVRVRTLVRYKCLTDL